jgi:hypothetical protein
MAYLRARDFGIDPASEDCTQGFQRLSLALEAPHSEPHVVELEPAIYKIAQRNRLADPRPDAARWPFDLKHVHHVTIEGRGAEIRNTGNRYTVYSGEGGRWEYPYGGLRLFRCGAIVVRDLTFDGGSGALIKGPSPLLVDAHGVALYGCTDVSLERVTARGHALDGFSLQRATMGPDEPSVHCTNIVLRECVADLNERNAISLTGARDCLFDRCRFTRTGVSPYSRTGPQVFPGAGVSIEPEGEATTPADFPRIVKQGRLEFRSCYVGGNRTRTVVCHHAGNEDVRFLQCVLEGGMSGSAETAIGSPGTLVQGCVVRTHELRLSNTSADDRGLSFIDNVVEIPPHGYMVTVYDQTPGLCERLTIERNTFISRGYRALQLCAKRSRFVDNVVWLSKTAYNPRIPIHSSIHDASDTVILRNHWRTDLTSAEGQFAFGHERSAPTREDLYEGSLGVWGTEEPRSGRSVGGPAGPSAISSDREAVGRD